jgi:predicted DCC family thiol-disulfide oxidoreductase YuxK
MATYYKYAERNADSQVNWAEVGKGISDMLKQEVQIREKKKADIDQATREFQNVLQNAPQGQYQDANKFTNDYAHSMMEQQMIDNRLLKSGQMKLQDFTFRRQNYVDGTSTLFDLQKLYQENYKKKMEGIQSGELQALTGANMASVEGFADFSKSKAVLMIIPFLQWYFYPLLIFWLIPNFIRDFIYDLISRNRKRYFKECKIVKRENFNRFLY